MSNDVPPPVITGTNVPPSRFDEISCESCANALRCGGKSHCSLLFAGQLGHGPDTEACPTGALPGSFGRAVRIGVAHRVRPRGLCFFIIPVWLLCRPIANARRDTSLVDAPNQPAKGRVGRVQHVFRRHSALKANARKGDDDDDDVLGRCDLFVLGTFADAPKRYASGAVPR